MGLQGYILLKGLHEVYLSGSCILEIRDSVSGPRRRPCIHLTAVYEFYILRPPKYGFCITYTVGTRLAFCIFLITPRTAHGPKSITIHG